MSRCQPRKSGISVVIYACVAIALFKPFIEYLAYFAMVLLVLIPLYGIWLGVRQALAARSVRRAKRWVDAQVVDAELRWRADAQAAALQEGDPYGVYGDYPAYTMPLTRPVAERPQPMRLDDYDDGLDW